MNFATDDQCIEISCFKIFMNFIVVILKSILFKGLLNNYLYFTIITKVFVAEFYKDYLNFICNDCISVICEENLPIRNLGC